MVHFASLASGPGVFLLTIVVVPFHKKDPSLVLVFLHQKRSKRRKKHNTFVMQNTAEREGKHREAHTRSTNIFTIKALGESNCRGNKIRTIISSSSFGVEIQYKRKAMMIKKKV